MKGKRAEDQALALLQSRGLRLVTRNFRSPLGELDLVMQDRGTLTIVEVRQRSHSGFATAAESVDWRKQQKIIQTTQLFLVRHPEYEHWPLRFDVIALDGSGQIDWIPSAFEAP